MSIADKITSIEGHLTADYEGLENIGADLTNVNKNIQNIRTCLDNIYSSLPKTTGEGSNLSLTTLKGRINVDDILGDTSQDTTNGYQLLDLTLAKLKTFNTSGTWSNNVYTISGATITINDDMSIKVNGTTTAQVTLMLNGGAIPYPTGTYYLSGASNGSNTTYDIRIFNYDGTSAVAQCFTGTKQIAVVNNSQSFNMAVVIRSGVTCNNTMFYPMLSTTNTSDYEPYTNGASPNPSYPQDINVVTGTQEVVVQTKNLAYIEAKGKYRSSASGNFSINANYNSYIAKVRPSTTYSGSFTNMASNYNDVSNLCYFDKNMNFISGNSYNTANKTFTTPSNCAYATMAVKTTITDFQVELGSTATSYIEHQEQTKTLHLGDIELAKIGTYQDRIFRTSGENLLDVSNMEAGTKNGITCTLNADKSITLSGTATAYTAFNIPTSLNGENIYCCDNWGSFTLYLQNGTTGVGYKTSNGTYTGEVTNLVIGITNNVSINKTLNLWVEDLSVSPYGSGKWYKKEQIKKIELVSSGYNWTYSSGWSKTNTNVFFDSHQTNDAYYPDQESKYWLSNYYGAYTRNELSALDNAGICLSGSKNITIRIAKTMATDLTTFTTWLDAYKPLFYYVLETPTYEEITNETLIEELNEIEKMMSYNGQTNISVSGNLPMILNVSALKGE